MDLNVLESSDVRNRSVAALGLPTAHFTLDSPEALAAAVRRAASFACPTPSRRLVAVVAEALRGLVDNEVQTRTSLAEIVEALVGCGDLIEVDADRSDAIAPTRELILGGPAYVDAGGWCLVVGIRPEGAAIASKPILELIDNRGHLRRLHLSEDVTPQTLESEGLRSIPLQHWLDAPRIVAASEVVADARERLAGSRDVMSAVALRVLDPYSPVRHYASRWREPLQTDEGMFVGRRPQEYGSDLWCVVQLRDGLTAKLLDLPLSPTSLWSGADEAWRLQAAIDCENGTPQEFRSSVSPGAARVDLFGPIPRWTQRRLDLAATRVERSRGALISYHLEPRDLETELRAIEQELWMIPRED